MCLLRIYSGACGRGFVHDTQTHVPCINTCSGGGGGGCTSVKMLLQDD